MNPSRRLASWLARSLGEYVEHIDEDSIGVGLWSGDLLLQSLDLRRDALRNFQLPVILHSGVVGCLRLKIPWKSFGSGGVTLRVADVTLVLEPVGSGFYDEALEEAIRTTVDAKKQELLAQAERALSGAHSSRGGGWTSRLLRALAGSFVSRALKSLKVEIENINVIWRLTSSSATTSKSLPAATSSSMYSAGAAIGVRLERFMLSPSGTSTTAGDAAAAAAVGSSVAAALAAKDLTLRGFSVYVIEEQAAALHAHQLLRQQLEQQQLPVAAADSRVYLLQPLAVQGAISLRQATAAAAAAAASSAQPSAGEAAAPEAPLLYVALHTPTVRATLSSRGCATVLSALAELAMARRRFGHRRGRPTVPVMADPAAWWHFAVAAVRTEVRTAAAGSAQRLSWASVVRRARTRAVYMAAYRRLLLFGFAESQRTSTTTTAAAAVQQQQTGSGQAALSNSSKHSEPKVQLSSEAKSTAAATAVKQSTAAIAAATSSAKKLTGRDVKMLAVQARGQVTARVRALAAAAPAAAQLAGRVTESEFLRLLAIEDSLSVEEILLYRGVARAQLQREGADSAAANKGAVRRAYGWLTGTTAAQPGRDAAAGMSEAGAAAGSDDASAAAASHWLACGEDEIEQVAGVMLEPLNDDDSSSSSSSSDQYDAPLLRWELTVGEVSAVCTTSAAVRSSSSSNTGDGAASSNSSSAGVKADLVLAVGVQKLTIDAYSWASGGSTCSAAVASVRAEGVGGCSLLLVRKGGTLRYDTRRILLGVNSSSSSSSTGTGAADRQTAAAVAGGHAVDVVFTLRPTEVTVPAAAVAAIAAFVSPACALPVLAPLLPPPPAAHEALRKLAAARRACSVPGHYEAARSRHTTYCINVQLAGVCVTLEAAAAEQALRLTVGPVALRSGYHLTAHLAQAAEAREGAAAELDTELLALAGVTRAAPLVETLLLQASGVDVALVRTLGTVSSSSSSSSHVDAPADDAAVADSSSRQHSDSSSSTAAASTTLASDNAAFCWSADPSSPPVRVVTAVTVAERGWGGDLLLARCVVPGHPTHPALRLDGVLSPLALDVSEQLVAAAACLSEAYKRALRLQNSSSSSSSNSSSASSERSSACVEPVPVPRLALLSPVVALQLSVRLAELQVRLLEPEEDDEVVDGAASSEGGGLADQEERDAARMLEETRRCVQQVSQSYSTITP
jgi:N-terminal region of Chorein or VPS13/Vacuolar sorting-associated protein 13, N-terminal